jgi:predicted dehydrogenase
MVGSTHVRVIPQMKSAKLVALCDHHPDRAVEAMRKAEVPAADVPVFRELDEMLRSVDVDVVHLATPSGTHRDIAIAAMAAGKHVICEKPLEIKTERVDAMIAAAQKHGVRLAGVFQNRWNEANRALKAAAEEGRYGTLSWAGCFTPWYRTDKYYQDGGWRGTWAMDGGGAVMNQSVHAIDLLQWIAGPVARVSAYAGSRIHPTIEVEDTLSCSLRFASGAFGTILGSTALYPGQPARVEIGGANGTGISENGLKVFKFRDERPADAELLARLAPQAKATGTAAANPADIGSNLHRRNLEAILGAWAENRDAETSGPEARKAVAIVEAMYESARLDGAPVDVA